MSQTLIARLLGAGLAAAAVTTAALTDWQQCGGNGLRGWTVFFLPVAVAVVFSLPRPDFAAYIRNGLAGVFGIATVAGVYGSGVEAPSSCELLYGQFAGYFVWWGVWHAIVLALGSIPFALLLLVYRRLRSHAAAPSISDRTLAD